MWKSFNEWIGCSGAPMWVSSGVPMADMRVYVSDSKDACCMCEDVRCGLCCGGFCGHSIVQLCAESSD